MAEHVTTVVSLRAPGPKGSYVRIDRTGKWGNPFVIGIDGDRAEVIAKYRAWLRSSPKLIAEARAELRGKQLACWCVPRACHGHVLADVAEGAEP